MPRIDVYRSLLFLTGIYSNLWGPFNEKEKVFLFFPIRFHIPFLRKIHRATLKSVCSFFDFHWKWCIAERRCEIKVTGILHHWPLRCLRNRQTDPARINMAHSKDWRFLSKKYRVISFLFSVDALPRISLLKTSPRNQQRIPGKWEDPNFERQAHWSNKKVKGRIGKFTRKHLSQKKN